MFVTKIVLHTVSEDMYSLVFHFGQDRSVTVPITRGISIKDLITILLDLARSMLYFVEEKK